MILANFLLLLHIATQIPVLRPRLAKVRPSNSSTHDPRGTNLNGTDFSGWVATMAARACNAVVLAQEQYDVQYPDA